MPITPAQLVQILISRNIGVRPVIIPGQPTRWKAGTYDQTHAEGRAHKGTFPSPEEAVEAADRYLAEVDQRKAATGAERLLASLDQADHYPRPREVDAPIGPGEPGKKTVWDMVHAKTGAVVQGIEGMSSPRAALEAMADKRDRDKKAAGGGGAK